MFAVGPHRYDVNDKSATPRLMSPDVDLAKVIHDYAS